MNGEMLGQVGLAPGNVLPQLVSSVDSISSAESSTVYVATQLAGDDNDVGYLYAIATQPGIRDASDATVRRAVTRSAQREEE